MVIVNNTYKEFLNIAPLQLNSNKITVGVLPNTGKENFLQLREKNWNTHAFRFDSRTGEILNVSLAKDVPPLGNASEVNVNEHLFLVAKGVQQTILAWLSKSLKILKNDKKIVFWGQAENALLLSKELNNLKLDVIDGLEVVLKYEIDCRMFQNPSGNYYLGLVLDVATSNIIDLPVSSLQEFGISIQDKYVCLKRDVDEDHFRPKLDLIGRVSEIQGNKLFLTDTEGLTEIESDLVFLEPRSEYLYEIIQKVYKQNSAKLISYLEASRRSIHTPNGKFAKINETLAGLRKRSLQIGNSLKINIGDLLDQTDSQYPSKISTERPILLFGSQGRNRTTYPDLGVKNNGPYMFMQNGRNVPLIAVVCEAKNRGRVEQFLNSLRSGFPNELWDNSLKPNPFPQGLIGKFRISKIHFEFEETKSDTSQAYKEATMRLLSRLQKTPDLAFVQIQERFKHLYGDENPYLVTKSEFMLSGVPTQSIRIENMELPAYNLPYLLNNVALATYAKLDGTPWVMATSSPTSHEIVIGLGSAEVSAGRNSTRSRYIGITSVFQGDGRYLLWGVTREVEYDNYADALLQSLSSITRHVQQHNSWSPGDRVRLIFHVFKRLKDNEVQAIKTLINKLVESQFEVDFAFLDISWQHPFFIFEPSQQGIQYWDPIIKKQKIKGTGVSARGIGLQLDNLRGLLNLTGPKELKSENNGTPKPLLIELHPDSDFTDLTYLMRQVYHFSYMSWRDFFPGTEPVTITYSRLIAKMLGNLKTVSNWNSNVVTVGALRERRWFL